MNNEEKHLDIYEDRYELHQEAGTVIYYQGFQSIAAQQRYSRITQILSEGFLDKKFNEIKSIDFSNLTENNQVLLRRMVDGITSEVGRALVGLVCLQLAIKSISPDQSVRLHKGSTIRGRFSWVDGISMRTLDKNFNTPFLRKHDLLNVNRDGVFMTRSLAENYPYSVLYKAEMKGPFDQWIEIVDIIENGMMPPDLGLSYLLALLQNRSETFKNRANMACSLTKKYEGQPFSKIKDLIVSFFNTTDYSARAFEVVMHGFYQAMNDMHLLGNTTLVPISQMRSANKKHGNVGDIELTENNEIYKSWDAKYGKPYLRDELEELRDKLLTHPDVEIAGFVCDCNVDLRKDVIKRKNEIEVETGCKIYLFTFEEWISCETALLNEQQKNQLAYMWLVAIVESFAQHRLEIAPIDEPCDSWINDLIAILSR